MWWFPGEGSALCVPVVELLSHRVVRRSPGGRVVGADVGLQVLADLAERGKATCPLERLPGITAHVDQMNVQIAQRVRPDIAQHPAFRPGPFTQFERW